MFKNLDWKYIGLTMSLLIASYLSFMFSAQVLAGIRTFFEFPFLNILAGTMATVITLVHKFKTRKFTFSATMSFSEFRVPVEDILSFVGGPITIVGSLSLAKGLYLQTTTSTNYFLFINNSVELTFIGLVAAYLFFISIMELTKNCKENFTLQKTNKNPITPIPQSEVKDTVPEIKKRLP